MKKGLGLLFLTSFLTLAVGSEVAAQYPPIDIDMEQTQSVDVVNNVSQSQEQSQVGAVDPRIHPHRYGYYAGYGYRDGGGKSLPKTGSDAMMLSLYALALFGIGMVLLKFVDNRRLRAARATAGPVQVAAINDPPAEAPREPKAGLYEGDIILPPYEG